MQQALTNTGMSSEIEAELYFLIARFLSGGPCRNAYSSLVEEIERHRLLPKRRDWLGNEHHRSFDNLAISHSHITSEHLLRICQRIGPILDKEVRPCVPGVGSLLGAGRQSLLRTFDDLEKAFLTLNELSSRLHNAPLLPPHNLRKHPNITQLLTSRELSTSHLQQHQVPTKFYKSMQLFCRRLGHLSSVYCLLFDRTGSYIFTGADDLLVKIWSTQDGRLLLTLRGHSAEITDMAVNYENTLLAAGSCDKLIRVWCLRTTAPVAVLTGHTGMITSLKFCPCPKGLDRYLISTGNDGCVFFWQWNIVTSKFNPLPRKYTERNRPGAQMQCSSFSPGGTFLATGSTDHHIRIYNVYSQNGPERVLEVEAHNDRVDSIQFCNHSERFVSGSKDGTANVWRYERQKWRKISLHMLTRLPHMANEIDDSKVPKFRVTMVGWDSDDKHVITAVNDFSLKVWNSYNGSLVYILEGHDDEVFVLEAHPSDPRIILSAGHDGRILLWDLSTGTMIKNLYNLIEGQGHGAVFDCKFSPDGRMFASTDSHGHLSIFGFGSNDKYRKIPTELFFHTDYRPLIRDANHHVLDEQTQQAPHLMPPPFLVNIDGDPYPPELQRLVPGRENCNDASLVPHVVSIGPGDIEILEAVRPSEENRHNIDVMIERLQRQLVAEHRSLPQPSPSVASDRGNAGPLSPRTSNRHPVHGHSPSHSRGVRRSGDVEGVRQSLANWQSRVQPSQGELLSWSRRVAVVNHDPALLSHLEEKRRALHDAEYAHYRNESKCRLEPVQTARDVDDEPRQKNGLRHCYRTRANRKKHVNNIDTEYEMPENGEQSSTSSSDSDDERGWKSGSSDSDSESSEYSDWTQDAGVNLQPPKRTLGKSKLKKIISLFNNNDDLKDGAGTSEIRRSRRSKRRRMQFSPNSESRECPLENRPSEWLAETVPHKAPYYPQMGDEIIYFQQGHRCYVQAVKRNKVYKQTEHNHPWHKLKLRDQELVKVVGIKYEIKSPTRLCCLKLTMIDPETGQLTGNSFTIKYHDMPDVIDFLVLRQTYDLAMSRNWKAGDKFRSLIDSKWWVGTIVSQEPFEAEFPDSMFQCFNVHWDSKDKEKMSPWDFEPLEPTRMPEEHGGSMPVLATELKALQYKPKEGEWPPHGLDEECDRILRGVEQIMELSVAEPFIVPVDLNAYPSYARIVEYPIDLSVIRARLESRFYRRVTSVQFDVRYLEHNTKKFNEPGSRIVKQARFVTDLSLKFIEDPTCTDIRPLYQAMNSEVSLHSDTPDSTPDQNSSDDDKSFKVVRKKQKNEYNSTSWKIQCKKFLDRIVQLGESQPFLAPVDPLEYPDYRDIIDTPMDLGTVKEQLLGDNYQSPIEVCKDMRLIFQNSRNYNVNKKSKIYSMTIRMSAYFENAIRSIISDWRSAVRYEQQLKNNKYVTTRRRPIPRASTDVSSGGRSSARGQLHSSPAKDVAGPSSRRFTSKTRYKKTRNSKLSEEEDNKENRVQNGRPRRRGRTKRATANGYLKKQTPQKCGRRKKQNKESESDELDVEDNTDSREEEEEQDEEEETEENESNVESEEKQQYENQLRRKRRRLTKKSPVKRPRQRNGRKVQVNSGNESSDQDSPSHSESKSSSDSDSSSKSKRSAKSESSQSSSSSSSTAKEKRATSSAASSSDNTEQRSSESGASDSENNASSETRRAVKSSSEDDSGSQRSSSDSQETLVRKNKKGIVNHKKLKEGSENCVNTVSSRSTSDVESGTYRRSRRTSTRNSTKATRNALKTKQHSKESVVPPATQKRPFSDSEDSCEPSRRSKRIATRNLGKRTVRYREDSEFEYSFDSGSSAKSDMQPRRRRRRRRRPKGTTTPANNNNNSSSRGRGLRHIAKGFIRR